MKKIVFVPLDERPCNFDYPIRLFADRHDVVVVRPSGTILGHKKTPANIDKVRQFVVDQSKDADILIFAAEMLAYGGLLPSRIYEVKNPEAKAAAYKAYVMQLKQANPKLVILASTLIMRTPQYSSNDEEPDYYEDYGTEIFKYGWLADQQCRDGLTDDKIAEFKIIKQTVPEKYIKDYEQRRAANLKINMVNIDLVKNNTIDYLAIPQDDSAPYGYTAMDQAVVYPVIKKERLQDKIGIYPGADETGYTLLARAMQIINHKQYKVYPFFASTIGQQQIPLYEDRPLVESVKAHILSTGARIVATPDAADIIFAVNTPGKKMIEASEQLEHPDVTYDTFRNLRAFVAEIKGYIEANKMVAIADSAYANGGDLELIGMLDEQSLLNKIGVYRGWNTNCNTLGSSIGSAIIQFETTQVERIHETLNNLVDDVFYQAIVRKATTDDWLPRYGLNYFDLKDKSDQVAHHVEISLIRLADDYLKNTLVNTKGHHISIEFPWNRMFEINCYFNFMEA